MAPSAPSAMSSEDPDMLKKAQRRGSATASASSSDSTFKCPNDNQKDDPTAADRPLGKAHRRVSFTTATTIEIDPPAVVMVDDITCQNQNESPWKDNVTASADTLPSRNTSAPTSCCSPSSRKLSRRTSLGSLEDTIPHHSDLAVHDTEDNQASPNYSTTHLSFPLARPNSPYRSSSALFRRPSSRRTSLDSCSTYSSAISSSCYSTAGSLAELLYSRDTAFQRTKLLECIEVLSRHLSRHAVQQLMQQVQQHQEQSGNVSQQIQEVQTGSSVEAKRRASTTVPSNTAAKNEVAATQPRRNSQPNPQKAPNDTFMSSPKRRSCCFVRHMSLSETEQSESKGAYLETSEHRRQQRRIRTQQSLERMSSTVQDSSLHDPFSDDDDDEALNVLGYEEPTPAPWGMEEELTTHLCIPPEAHRSALLLCDISGFTALSNTLSLQALSETINAYFQRIVTCIQEYGGDVVKFAGDAVIAEWRQEDDDARVAEQLFSQEDLAGEETKQPSPNAVQLATACACQIIQTCSDYHVYEDMAETRRLATLNVHCGIGVGTLVGFHAGDDTRREYMLLGDPISQAAEGIALGQGGEVVASPQVYACLSTDTEEDESSNPRVVFSSRQGRDQKSPGLLDPDKLLLPPPDDMQLKTTSKLWKALLREWDVAALFKLQELMALYVHPVVVEGELFTSVFPSRGILRSTSFDSVASDTSSQQNEQQQQCLEHEQRRHQSEAELRRVFTVFIQPEVPVTITGEPAQDEIVMITLNQIMVLANRELARFKGQLRQFVVDDKGVVLIANFGLRGSVYPRMIEEHAMPFAASIRSVLLSELNISCRIGATYDRAYCGVVGGVERHEYSVLGPAVNLAARLMGDHDNRGFLVASGVHGEAAGWSFRALKPIRAKGYAYPVPIFEPIMHRRSPWQRAQDCFLGREAQLDSILELSEDLICSGCSTAKMILISASSGVGKSTLMTEAVNRVQARCEEMKRSHIVLGQVCCEGDLFRPLCVLGPVLLDILAREGTKKEEMMLPNDGSPAVEMVHGPAGTALCNSDGAMAVKLLYAACLDAGVTSTGSETIHSLVFHHEWPESYDETDVQMSGSQRRSASERNEIAQLIVSIILQYTVDLDFVLLGVDNVSMMDELSWKVIEIWFTHACNLFFVGTSEPLTLRDFNISPTFSDYLFNQGLAGSQFLQIDLPPLGFSDIERLIDYHQNGNEARMCSGKRSPDFAREVYLQSGGNPRLAVDIIERFAGDSFCFEEGSKGQESFDVLRHRSIKTTNSIDSAGSGMAAHVLQKLDSVPAMVRTHLNLAALLGDVFTARDVTRVLERFRGVKDWDKDDHAKLVLDSLNEAVVQGILSVATENSVVSANNLVNSSMRSNADGITYKFTHGSWREKISQLTLDSWRQDILVLIREISVADEQ